MGWLEGVLTGYADRHYEIQREKMRQAEQAADREERVFQTLLNSKYADIQDYAAAGILDLSNPRRRAGGVAGWMGEVEKTPYLDMIKRTRERISDDPEFAESNIRRTDFPWLGNAPPATPSVPTAAGSVPGTGGSAALPSTSQVTGGPATPPTPAPTAQGTPTSPGQGTPASPPPAPPQGAAGGAPTPPTSTAQVLAQGGTAPPGQAGQAGAQAGPPMPPAGPPLPVSQGPPPPPGQVGAGLPGATTQPVGGRASVPLSRTQLPGIFPTATDTAMDAAVARSAGTDLGEQQSYIRVARAQGLTDAEGLQMWAEAQMKARGGAGAASPYAWRTMEYTDAQGNKRRILARTNKTTGKVEDINGNPLPPNAVPVTPGLYPYEVAARRQAQNALLWNQALTQARSVLGVNATAEEVIDFADQLFTQSQSMAPTAPAVAPGAVVPGGVPAPAPTPAPGGAAAPGAGAPVVAPGAAPGAVPGAVPDAAAAGAGAPAAPAAPVEPALGTPGAPATQTPTSPAASPGAALKGGLKDSGLLDRKRDEGRPATAPERDVLGFYLRARQPLDAIMAPGKDGLSLEDRLVRGSLGSQFARRLTPDILDFLLPGDAQLYKTAAERFTEARVRKVSGAQIRPDEYETDRKMFFAQPGDTLERIAEKQRLREAEMDAVVFAAGPAYNEYFKKPYTPSYMRQDPNATKNLPPAMPGPPPNRAVPRLIPSHTPTTPPTSQTTTTIPQSAAPPPPPVPGGTPKAVKGPDGSWYIVFE